MATTKYIDGTHALVLAEDTALIVLPANPLSIPVGYTYTVVDNYGIAEGDPIGIAAEFDEDIIGRITIDYGLAVLQWTGNRYAGDSQGAPPPAPAISTIVNLNMLRSYALPNGTTAGQTVWVFDNLGLAGINPQTVTGHFNVGNSLVLSQAGQAILFVWDGLVWDVPSIIGLLPDAPPTNYYQLNERTTFDLPDGTFVNELATIVDNLGLQEMNQPVINATANTPLVISFPYGSASAFWNGSMWVAILPSINIRVS